MVDLTLRPIEVNDLERIRGWLNVPDLAESIQSRAVTSEQQRVWFDRYQMDKSKKVFAILFNGNHIGNVSLFNIDRVACEAMLTIFIGEAEFRGCGIGTKVVRKIFALAQREFDLRKIHLEVLTNNFSAIKCYEKVGMKAEKTLSNRGVFQGKPHDMLKMSVDLGSPVAREI